MGRVILIFIYVFRSGHYCWDTMDIIPLMQKGNIWWQSRKQNMRLLGSSGRYLAKNKGDLHLFILHSMNRWCSCACMGVCSLKIYLPKSKNKNKSTEIMVMHVQLLFICKDILLRVLPCCLGLSFIVVESKVWICFSILSYMC